jgi:hypothetical protein
MRSSQCVGKAYNIFVVLVLFDFLTSATDFRAPDYKGHSPTQYNHIATSGKYIAHATQRLLRFVLKQHTTSTMPASSQVEILSSPDHTFDYESADPMMAMSAYSRDMFSHTKQQMQHACTSSRRRSGQRNSIDSQTSSLSKSSTRSSNTSETSL